MAQETRAMARIVEQIARDHPAAIAGPAEFWARITGLSVEEATAALEALAARGVMRRQALGEQRFFVADPPHADQADAREESR